MEPSIKIIEDRLDQERTAPQSTGNTPMVTIRNKRTGETKQIPATQAQDFGIDPEEAFKRVVAQQKLSNLEQGLPAEPKEDEATSGDVAKLRGSTKSGLESLNRVQPKIEEGGLKRTLQLFGARSGNLPFGLPDITPFGRSIEADLENVADVILRFRTGAQANEQEISKFVRAFAPAVTDSQEVREQKLNTLRTELEEVASSVGLEVDDLLQNEKKNDLGLETSEDKDIGFKNVEPGADLGVVNSLDETPPELKEEGILDDLTSPSTLLSTAGDLAGEVVGVPLAPLTGGAINPITASGALAGAGEFIGSLIEGKDFSEAQKEAIIAAGVSAFTPMTLRLAGKVAKPAFKIPGKFVADTLGRNLTKLGNQVTKKIGGEALERGINVFDEMGARGIASVPRDEALQAISQGFKEAEPLIKQGIEESGNPVVLTVKQLDEIVDNTIDDLLIETSDINAVEKLRDTIKSTIKRSKTTGRFKTPEVLADEALDLKRKIFRKVPNTKGSSEAKFRIAGQINDALKGKVSKVKDLLREEEKLFFMDEIFRNLRNEEFVKSGLKNFNLINPLTILNLAGTRRVAGTGQVLEKAGGAIKQVPEKVVQPALNALDTASKFVRQPIRGAISSE